MKKGFLAATAMAALVAATADAADVRVAPTEAYAADLGTAPAREVLSPRQFGCYVGVFGEGIVSHPEFANVPVPGAFTEYYAKGGRGGGVIGCDVRFVSRTFLGIDFTAAYGSLPGTGGSGIFKSDMPFEGAGRVRLGYLLDPALAVYVAGGFAVAQLKTTDVIAGVSDEEFIWGGQLAVGIEHYFTTNWRARAEYAYTYYGSDTVGLTGFPLVRLNPTSHAVRFGVVFGN
jgi:outer membrane immunogenic protein